MKRDLMDLPTPMNTQGEYWENGSAKAREIGNHIREIRSICARHGYACNDFEEYRTLYMQWEFEVTNCAHRFSLPDPFSLSS
jgi:hypothetical protein